MSVEKQLFGVLEDGREVHSYTLINKNGMKAKIADYGGTILQILAPDGRGRFTDVVGGYDNIYDYVHASGYQGALIGRFGNRIAEGKFTLDGKEYDLYLNNNGNHLHGGKDGFNAKIWDVVVLDEEQPSLVLSYTSPDGEENYPGTLGVRVTYTLSNDNALSIRYEATTDKKTILNLTNHTYFNLGGYACGTVRDHTLWLDADTYVKTNDKLIPTGELASVENTPFDFRTEKKVGRDIDAPQEDLLIAGGYDHCFNFVGGESKEPVLRAILKHEKSGRVMKMYTNQPCVQLYTGNFLEDDGHPFKGGCVKQKQMALCLETQHMPDSVHHENFTNVVLDVGEKYDYTTIYAFSAE
jgi:aldose 1-epimerase